MPARRIFVSNQTTEVDVVKNLHLTLVPLGIALMVAGCGGGGSSSSGGSSGGIPTAAVQITSTNASKVAGGSNGAAVALTSTSGKGTTGGVVAAVTQSTAHLPSVLDHALAEFNKVRNLPIPAASATGAIQGNNGQCPQGSYARTYTDADNSGTLTIGDTISVKYTNCYDGTVTNNGTLAITINALTSADIKFTLNYAGYSFNDATTTVSMDGDQSYELITTGTTVTQYEFIMSGSSFTMTDSASKVSTKLTSYNETYKYDTAGFVSYSPNMTVASTDLGGSVTITTSPAFSIQAGSSAVNPTAGSMTITGAGGSFVTLTAQPNGTDVVIVVDDDGAAGPHAPATINTTWALL